VNAGERIAIAGVGTVGPWGAGADALARWIRAGEPDFGTIDRGEGFHPRRAPSRVGAVPPEALAGAIPPLIARRMSPPSRYAVAAARLALEQAGRAVPDAPDPSVAVVMGTAFGPSSYTQRLLDQILGEGPAAASPALFTECVASAPASQVSIQCRAAGPNLTVVEREASGPIAVARAAALVARGRARFALAGAVDEMTPLLHSILGRFGALARSGRDGAEAARPFDARRDGFLAAEGATVLALEDERAALARGARPVARLAAWRTAFDPTAGQVGWGRGAEGLARALARMLAEHDVAPESFGLIVSGASGARSGDRLEAEVLRRVWGARALPPIVAPKSIVGEYGGGFLAAAVRAFVDPPGTSGFAEVDPELGIRPLAVAPREPVDRVLVTAVASGGPACWLVLDRD